MNALVQLARMVLSLVPLKLRKGPKVEPIAPSNTQGTKQDKGGK